MGNNIGRRRQVVDEKYTRPNGLYQHRDIDHKKLRKLILDSKLAPCYPGDEDCSIDLEECPICFLYYPSLNRSRCCMKGICTECFLQMKPPHSTRPTQCPFCKTSNYVVEYRGVRTKEEKGIEQVEEQKVIEAQLRMRQQELQDAEERMQKRQDLSSSSRLMNAGEIEYQDVANSSVPSFRYSAHGSEIVSSEGSFPVPASRQPSHSRQNSDHEYLSKEEMGVIQSFAAKRPIKRSARLAGECAQMESIPVGEEYAGMADNCGYILKDVEGKPMARILDKMSTVKNTATTATPSHAKDG